MARSPVRRMFVTAAVGLVAALWAAVFASSVGFRSHPPSAEQAAIAIHLVQGHGFRSPMDPSASAPPTAWSPPVYPAVIALAYRVFGIQSGAALTALMVLNALAFGGAAAALYRLGDLLFRSETPALVAAGVFMVHPSFLIYAGDFWDGMISLALFLWLTFYAARLGLATRHPWTRAIALGAGMGILALMNSAYVATFPVLLVIAFLGAAKASRWRLAGLSSLMVLVVIAPWTIRNYSAFRTFVFIRTGVALQFWLGNAPVSDGWLDERAYSFHPYTNASEQALLISVGEPAYNAIVFERFRHAAAQDPLTYAVNCLRRTRYLLIGGAPSQPTGIVLANGIVALMGLTGLVVAWRLGYPSFYFSLLVAAAAAPFVMTAVIDRYALPIRSLLVLFAAAFCWSVMSRVRFAQPPDTADRHAGRQPADT